MSRRLRSRDPFGRGSPGLEAIFQPGIRYGSSIGRARHTRRRAAPNRAIFDQPIRYSTTLPCELGLAYYEEVLEEFNETGSTSTGTLPRFTQYGSSPGFRRLVAAPDNECNHATNAVTIAIHDDQMSQVDHYSEFELVSQNATSTWIGGVIRSDSTGANCYIGGYYAFGTREFRIFRRTGGSNTTLASATIASLGYDVPAITNKTFRITAVGDTIELWAPYVDPPDLLLSATDSNHTGLYHGMLGYGTTNQRDDYAAGRIVSECI